MPFALAVKFLLIINVCVLFAMGQDSKIISLDEVLSRHVQHTNNVQIQRKAYDNALREYSIFNNSLLPSVEINYTPISFSHSMKILQSYMSGAFSNVEDYSNATLAGVIVKQTIGATGGVLSMGTSMNYLREFSTNTSSFSTRPLFVSYTQQIFGGRKNFRYRQCINKKTFEVAKKNFCSAVAKEEQAILILYLDACSAKMKKEYYDRECEIGDSLLNRAKLCLQVGNITEYDFNQIELRQMENIMGQVKSKDNYVHAIRLLETELHLKNMDVCLPNVCRLPKTIECDEVIELVMKNNPEYQNNELQRLNAEYALYNAKLNNRFNASVSITYGLNQYAHTLKESYNKPNHQQVVTVELSIPIWDWGMKKHRIKIMQNNFDMTILQQETATAKLHEQVVDVVNSYNRYAALLNIVEKRYDLSKRQYEFAVMRFSVGKICATDLISSANEQFEAMQELATVQRELYTTYYHIRHITMYDFIGRTDLTLLPQ